MDFRRYINSAPAAWDEPKNDVNKAKHRLDFADFRGFDGEPVVRVDDRFDYGETRLRAAGRIAGVPYLLTFTMRGNQMRIISWRRAHEKELRFYEQTTATTRVRD